MKRYLKLIFLGLDGQGVERLTGISGQTSERETGECFSSDKARLVLRIDLSSEQIGRVSAYYSKIGVAAIELTATLSIGESIRVKGATTDFITEITSMQIDRVAIESADAGVDVGVQVPSKVRKNDAVFRA